jgi:hypothetical protein
MCTKVSWGPRYIEKFLMPKMLFEAKKIPWKVLDPNFSNWDVPLKWPYKLIPPIFSTMKGSK